MESEEFLQNFCNDFWRMNIGVHCTSKSTLLGAVDIVDGLRTLPDIQLLKSKIEELNLGDKIDQYIMLDRDFIVGFKFFDECSKLIFENFVIERFKGDIRYIIIKEEGVRKVKVHINAFPLSFSKEMLQEALNDYGEITDFDFLTENRYNNHWKSNNVLFTIKLLKDMGAEDLPCFVKVGGYPLMLMARGLPPVCHRCKSRGHHAKSCMVIYCTDCCSYTSFIHNCISQCRPQEGWLAKLKIMNENAEKSKSQGNEEIAQMAQNDNLSNILEAQQEQSIANAADSSVDNYSGTDIECSVLEHFSVIPKKRKRRKRNRNKVIVEDIKHKKNIIPQEDKTCDDAQVSNFNIVGKVVTEQLDSYKKENFDSKSDQLDVTLIKNDLWQPELAETTMEMQSHQELSVVDDNEWSPEINVLFDKFEKDIGPCITKEEITKVIFDYRLNNPHIEDIDEFCEALLRNLEHYSESFSEKSENEEQEGS